MFIQADGRVIDHSRNEATTSEGQSYAMLRSVWMDDRSEFDTVWRWTQSNLQVRHDRLFSYLWGQKSNGSWTLLNKNSASDADEDIALALVMASHRWNTPSYLTQARAIIRDIWRVEVTTVKGKPYLTAGNWAPAFSKPGPALDPSYFAPYAYRIFATVDRGHKWNAVVDTAYSALAACSADSLGGSSSANLPPNWCAVVRSTGKVAGAPSLTNANLYGYDAFRSMWRIALDDRWYHDPRAAQFLRSSSFLRTTWSRTHKLVAQYTHSGTPATRDVDPTTEGGSIGNFVVTAPDLATEVVTQSLLPSLHRGDTGMYFGDPRNYYEQNWVWFGLALYSDRLPNLAG
jgi:endoglucanase